MSKLAFIGLSVGLFSVRAGSNTEGIAAKTLAKALVPETENSITKEDLLERICFGASKAKNLSDRSLNTNAVKDSAFKAYAEASLTHSWRIYSFLENAFERMATVNDNYSLTQGQNGSTTLSTVLRTGGALRGSADGEVKLGSRLVTPPFHGTMSEILASWNVVSSLLVERIPMSDPNKYRIEVPDNWSTEHDQWNLATLRAKDVEQVNTLQDTVFSSLCSLNLELDFVSVEETKVAGEAAKGLLKAVSDLMGSENALKTAYEVKEVPAITASVADKYKWQKEVGYMLKRDDAEVDVNKDKTDVGLVVDAIYKDLQLLSGTVSATIFVSIGFAVVAFMF